MVHQAGLRPCEDRLTLHPSQDNVSVSHYNDIIRVFALHCLTSLLPIFLTSHSLREVLVHPVLTTAGRLEESNSVALG